MIKYAYSRGHPIQIIIGANKETIISEKKFTARRNQTMAVGFSEVIWPKDYPDFEFFMNKIQETWEKEWNIVFSANLEELPELPEPTIPEFDYPFSIRFYLLLCMLANISASMGLTWFLFRGFWGVLALLGPLQWPVAGVFVAYVTASLYVYSQPVSAVQVKERMSQQQKKTPPPVAIAGKKDE